ncbi:uncharacterized protein [Primulina huaijiensis]|uniref:uncharacterized protein n=1 Tax=Primulina huaijiensis TaxID=1492673 RepID=UPI003CC77B01
MRASRRIGTRHCISKRFLKEMEFEATFGSTEETCQLHGMGDVPLTFPVDGGSDRWNAKAENVVPKDHDSRTTDSSRKEDQSGYFYCLTSQDGDSESFSSGSPSKSSVSESITKDSDAEDSMQKGEAETFIVSTHPIQEFSARCVLNLFLDSFDIENNKSVARKEIPSRKSVSENSVDSSAESNEDAQARNTSYSDAIIDNVKQQPAESREMGEHKNAAVDRNSSTIQTQCTHKNQDSENNDSQVIKRLFPKHEHVKSGKESVTTQMQYDEREPSFSASGLIAFSGSIAYSGSLSLRSDCSVTSARSFAFPILQSEWSGSPVRMAKADKRHFRKHRCWTSGLLCCRF